jgi:hypothetical protein
VHPIHSVVEVLNTLGRFRRKEFERDTDPPGGIILREHIMDVHLDILQSVHEQRLASYTKGSKAA